MSEEKQESEEVKPVVYTIRPEHFKDTRIPIYPNVATAIVVDIRPKKISE